MEFYLTGMRKHFNGQKFSRILKILFCDLRISVLLLLHHSAGLYVVALWILLKVTYRSNYLPSENISEVKIVQQMPIQSHGNKPSVAIITSKYYEKLAVDAMMENKTTFVRYKTEGRLPWLFILKLKSRCIIPVCLVLNVLCLRPIISEAPVCY